MRRGALPLSHLPQSPGSSFIMKYTVGTPWLVLWWSWQTGGSEETVGRLQWCPQRASGAANGKQARASRQEKKEEPMRTLHCSCNFPVHKNDPETNSWQKEHKAGRQEAERLICSPVQQTSEQIGSRSPPQTGLWRDGERLSSAGGPRALRVLLTHEPKVAGPEGGTANPRAALQIPDSFPVTRPRAGG